MAYGNALRDTRQVAAEAEALLVDAEWAAPEPEPVVAVVTNHRDEPDEQQRTLFS